MKIFTSPKKRCDKCYFSRKKGNLYVRCSVFPRHKQKQNKKNKK